MLWAKVYLVFAFAIGGNKNSPFKITYRYSAKKIAMKIIASILVLVFLLSCEPKPDKNNSFSHVIYESKTDITIKINKDKFQITSPYLRKPGTTTMGYLREVMITNHSNKMFLIGSHLPEHKIVSSYEIKGYSTARKGWRFCISEPFMDTFYYNLPPNTTDTFRIIDPLDGLDSALFEIEIHEKGKLATEPKLFYVHKGML